MEIAAVAAVTKCFGAGKAYFAQCPFPGDPSTALRMTRFYNYI